MTAPARRASTRRDPRSVLLGPWLLVVALLLATAPQGEARSTAAGGEPREEGVGAQVATMLVGAAPALTAAQGDTHRSPLLHERRTPAKRRSRLGLGATVPAPMRRGRAQRWFARRLLEGG